MARAKRLYFCELIPLWELDDDHLEVDWSKEEAKNGEIIEMKVLVKDLNLNLQTPDFSVEFEIAENDFLFFGGWDDHQLTFSSKAEKDKEHRSLSILGPNDAVPPDQLLKKIFVSPVPNQASQRLIRAFWSATWREDVSGLPEYFFDVRLEFTGKKFEERSDHELTVSKEAFATGAPVGGATATGGPLVLPAVGWSLKEIFAEKSVDQLALLDHANTGKPVSFVITPDDKASLLWILLIPKSNDASGGPALIKKSWTVPRFLPLENIENLSLKAKIDGKEVKASTVAKAEAEKFSGQSGGFFAELTLHEGRLKSTPPDPATPVNEQQQRANAFLTTESSLKRTVDKELAKWATANSKNITPTDADYAFTLQEFEFSFTHGPDSLILERPASAAALTKWKESFRKAYVLGLMIMTSGSGITQREERAALIAADLAEAEFITEALNLTNLFSTRELRKFPYETILKGGKLTATQWTTILSFFTAGTGTIGETDFPDAFGFSSGTVTLDGVTTHRLLPTATNAFITKLGSNNTDRNTKLEAITTAFIATYANDPDLIWVLSGFLFFQQSFRQPFADKMWSANQSYLLFKIINSQDFLEPGYGEQTWDGKTLTMATDMTWVYQNKQRFAVDFLVFLCERDGTPIPRPTNLNFDSLRSWLEAHTETIAAAAPKVYGDNKKYFFQLYELVTDIYFFHVDRGDVIPDLHGHIGGLAASHPGNLRMRADCDVFAAYGTRFLRAKGFTSIGFMGIMPVVTVGTPIGHAGALLKKDGAYFVVNNKQAYRVTAANDAEGEKKLRDEILDILNNPTNYEVYYAPPDATGGMSVRIREQGPEIRRTDLE